MALPTGGGSGGGGGTTCLLQVERDPTWREPCHLHRQFAGAEQLTAARFYLARNLPRLPAFLEWQSYHYVSHVSRSFSQRHRRSHGEEGKP